MAALTDERPNSGIEPLEGQPSPPAEATQEGTEGAPETAPPTSPSERLTREQIQEAFDADEDLRKWHQAETDRKAAAQAEAWNRQNEQKRLTEAQQADDARYDRIQESILDGQVISEDDEAWFGQHRNTRRNNAARLEVLQQWATDYDQARAKNTSLPDFRAYIGRSTSDLIEDIYQAGRASREPDIQAEAKKLAEAMTAEQMAAHRSTLPNPNLTRTSAGGGEAPGSLDDARAWHAKGQTPSGQPFTNDDMRRYLAGAGRT